MERFNDLNNVASSGRILAVVRVSFIVAVIACC